MKMFKLDTCATRQHLAAWDKGILGWETSDDKIIEGEIDIWILLDENKTKGF